MADCAPIVAGLIIPADEHTVIALVVDDSEDDALTSAIAEAETVPSEHFGGAWRAQIKMDSERGEIKYDFAEFLLLEYGGGMERCFAWANPHDELEDLVSSQEHYVALLPAEYAGPMEGEVEPMDFLPRLAGSLIAEVSQPSDAIAKLRDVRRQ